MIYQYVNNLFIVTGKNKVIIKSCNTLCTIKTGWLSGNKHFHKCCLKVVGSIPGISITNILLYFTVLV